MPPHEDQGDRLGAHELTRRAWLAAGAGVAAVGALAWWQDDDSLARLQAQGVLRFGTAIEPPYALLLPDGTPVGESPGVARAVAERLSLRPQWIVTAFDRLLDELEGGRFDVIAAGLFVSEARAQRVAFCRPQLRVRPGWLTRAGNPAGLGPYEALGSGSPVRVAVLEGSVEAAGLARRGVTLLRVPDARSGVEAVRGGQADGLALSWPSVSHLAAAAGAGVQAVSAAAPGQRADQVAMAVRRGDRALQAAIDRVLQDYLGSPGHLALLQALGLGAADLPEAGHAAS